MLKSNDEEHAMKTLEIQCLFLVKQLKKNLKKQLYRQVINKTQKLISKNNDHLSELCAQIMLKILFLESKAILKVLQKNVYKKYLYPQVTVRKLLKILNRNNSICNAIIVTKIKSKQIIEHEYYRLKTYDGSNQCNLFKYEILRGDFIKIIKSFSQIYLTSVLYQFANFANYNFAIEKQKKFIQLLQNLSQNAPNFSFKTSLSLISIQLSLCKILFENNLYSHCLKMIHIIIQMLLNLHFKIRLQYQNKEKTQLKSKELQKILLKKKHYIKKVLKYLIISMVIMIRINMKYGFQNIVIEAINIFNFIIEKSGENQLGIFKKYLNPEIYIYQQFCRYRAEKFQIQQIIRPLFAGMIEEMKANLKSTTQIDIENQRRVKSDMYNFYNQKMVQFREKFQNQTKKQQIKRTANQKILQSSKEVNKPLRTDAINSAKKVRKDSSKSKGSAKIKQPVVNSLHTDSKSFTTNLGQTCESEDFLNLEKDIIEDLQKSNRAYFTTRVQSKIQQNRWSNIECPNDDLQKPEENETNDELGLDSKLIDSKNSTLKIVSRLVGTFFTKPNKDHLNNGITTKQIIKGKRLARSGLVKKQDYEKSINIPAQAQKLQQMKAEMLKSLKNNIELLKEKKNNKASLIMKYSNSEDILLRPQDYPKDKFSFLLLEDDDPPLNGGSRQIQEMESYNSYVGKKSSMMNININYKDKLKHLNKKSKLQMFIEVLTKNKEHFGVKKWSEKIQYIKKKQQLKEKLRSTRKTTSINLNGFKKLGPKMSSIAGDLLMQSLEEIEEYTVHKNQKWKKGTFDNSNSYQLGMKSIQILMNSLQKEKQTYAQSNEKQQRMNRTARTERKYTCKSKQKNHLHNSVGKLNNKNNLMCKFVL